MAEQDSWPELSLDGWLDTYQTIHMWTQVAGKLRLELSPVENHWWHIALYVDSRGLTTNPMPCTGGTFEVRFDFVGHEFQIEKSAGQSRTIKLRSMPVADFYSQAMDHLQSLGIDCQIWPVPSEVPDPIPFKQDTVHNTYDPDAANRMFRVLSSTTMALRKFRSSFIGKCSPVHFFWGSFDIAYTRFSGRKAPEHPGGGLLPDWITREAYSHEVFSVGFWPGGGPIPYPVFYAYAYPEPPGFPDSKITPSAAFYSGEMKEFFLPYEVVRASPNPEATLLEFASSTYEAVANLGSWDREPLER